MKMLFILLFVYCYQATELFGQSEQPLTYEEKMPEFPGGLVEMYKYVASNLKYPAQAKALRVSGQVNVRFVVQANGEITDAKAIRGIGHGCDEEAIRVVLSMNENHRWIPGLHNGKAVPVTFTLPLKFVLP